VTTTHITEVSPAASFLLEAAKKTDREFRVTPQSHAHTMRDATGDIRKVMQHLLDKSVTTETKDQHTPAFLHPSDHCWEKMNSSEWLAAVLTGSLVEEEDVTRGEVELDYELSDCP